MLVLGIQGSPRKKGNTNYLLSLFMEEAEKLGAETEIIEVSKKNIKPCMEYIACEKKGYCPIKDDMEEDIMPLLRKADVIIPATPIFFYSCTAQLKLLIDRTQPLWARKYMLKMTDPARNHRKGFLLSLGATKGKNLFEGMIFTAKYFFDAVGASYDGELTYRKIENPGDMEKHPGVKDEVREAVEKLIKPLLSRKKILFASEDDSSLSQIAAAYTQFLAGKDYEVLTGGKNESAEISKPVIQVMEENGIDMAYRKPASLDTLPAGFNPHIVVYINSREGMPEINGAAIVEWKLPDKQLDSKPEAEKMRVQIESMVKDFIDEIK